MAMCMHIHVKQQMYVVENATLASTLVVSHQASAGTTIWPNDKWDINVDYW